MKWMILQQFSLFFRSLLEMHTDMANSTTQKNPIRVGNGFTLFTIILTLCKNNGYHTTAPTLQWLAVVVRLCSFYLKIEIPFCGVGLINGKIIHVGCDRTIVDFAVEWKNESKRKDSAQPLSDIFLRFFLFFTSVVWKGKNISALSCLLSHYTEHRTHKNKK